MNKGFWIVMGSLAALVVIANGWILWPFEVLFGLLAGIAAALVGIAIAVISIPVALLGAAVAVVGALVVATVTVMLALLPVLLPVALLVGFIWLVVRVANSGQAAVVADVPR